MWLVGTKWALTFSKVVLNLLLLNSAAHSIFSCFPSRACEAA
jgi:hypothetical protein